MYHISLKSQSRQPKRAHNELSQMNQNRLNHRPTISDHRTSSARKKRQTCSVLLAALSFLRLSSAWAVFTSFAAALELFETPASAAPAARLRSYFCASLSPSDCPSPTDIRKIRTEVTCRILPVFLFPLVLLKMLDLTAKTINPHQIG